MHTRFRTINSLSRGGNVHVFSCHISAILHPYSDGIETIVFVVSAVRVLMSVHWITVIGPLQYVSTCFLFLVAAGMFIRLHITVPVRVVLMSSSSVASMGHCRMSWLHVPYHQ